MKEIEVNLNKFGTVINTEEKGETCYKEIMQADPINNRVVVRMKNIVSMTTTRAKQIFGRIYKQIGEERFANNLVLDCSDGVYIIIEMGLEEMLADEKKIAANRGGI